MRTPVWRILFLEGPFFAGPSAPKLACAKGAFSLLRKQAISSMKAACVERVGKEHVQFLGQLARSHSSPGVKSGWKLPGFAALWSWR